MRVPRLARWVVGIAAAVAAPGCQARTTPAPAELPAKPTQTAGALVDELRREAAPLLVFDGVIQGSLARLDALPSEQPLAVERVKGTECHPGPGGCDAGPDLIQVLTCEDIRSRAGRLGVPAPAWCASDPLPKCNEPTGNWWSRARQSSTPDERLRSAGRGTLVVRVHADDWVSARPLAEIAVDIVALGPLAWGRTDGAGEVVLDSLRPGDQRLRVRAIGYERREFDVKVRVGFVDTVLVAVRTEVLHLECPGRRVRPSTAGQAWSLLPDLETVADPLARTAPALDSVRTPVIVGRLLDGYWQDPRAVPAARIAVRPASGRSGCRGRGGETRTDGRGEFVVPAQLHRTPFRLDSAALVICEASPGDEPPIAWGPMGWVALSSVADNDTLHVECTLDADGPPCVRLERSRFLAQRRPEREAPYSVERAVANLAGCYRITVDGSTSGRQFAIAPGPRVFELTTELHAVGPLGARFYRAAQVSGPDLAPWAPDRRPLWTAQPSSERVTVHIYDEEHGVSLTVWQEDWDEDGEVVAWSRSVQSDTTRWPPYGFAHGLARGERVTCR